MLNIVIPMAGHGSRFRTAGYPDAKPLIPVFGKPMIRLVIENLRPSVPHRFVFLCLEEHLESGLREKLSAWAPGCVMIPVREVTEGAACTVLLARGEFESADPLLIANCDQWVDVNMDAFLNSHPDASGLIMTFDASDPKWSYCRMDGSGRVVEVAEKRVISREATVGIYQFARGEDFAAGADEMIRKNIRVNNEFYVAPVYNELIARGGVVRTFNIGTEGRGMHGLGTPGDLEMFLKTPPPNLASKHV